MAVICSCHAVNTASVRRLIDDGARSVDDITAGCGAGDDCGSCRPTLEAILADHLGPEAVLAAHLGPETPCHIGVGRRDSAA